MLANEVAVLDGLKVLNFLTLLTQLFDDAGHGFVVEVNLIATEDVCVPSLPALQENFSILVGSPHVLDDDAGPDAALNNIVHPVDRLTGRQVGLSPNARRTNLVLLNLIEDGLAISTVIVVAAFNPTLDEDAERVRELESAATGRVNSSDV